MVASDRRATTRAQAHRGWDSDFAEFTETPRKTILSSLRRNYPDSSQEEIASWRGTVPAIQQEVSEVVQVDSVAGKFTAVLEYELPMEARRADAVLLLHRTVLVLELKGKSGPTDADIDQAHAYARDLRSYHRECHDRPIHAVLVPTLAQGPRSVERNVHVCPPAELDALVGELDARTTNLPLDADRFLSANAYKPLPSLVRAARALFLEKRPPQLWKSAANTDAAVEEVERIIAEAQATKTRRLVLLHGVPGSGKTLVGLRLVHTAGAESHEGGEDRPSAIFLTGNRPLADVLQYTLKGAGGDGKVFVRHAPDYVLRFIRHSHLVPNENIVVFDEAQRAFDADRMKKGPRNPDDARSQPEHFVEFAERVPDWSVIVGLIGAGQEINAGEEGGLGLWVKALSDSANGGEWIVHGPEQAQSFFTGLSYELCEALSLDSTLRSHRAAGLHEFVAKLLAKRPASPEVLSKLATSLQHDGHDLRITRCRGDAERYLRERYQRDPSARFGVIASSRDKDFGSQDWRERRRIKIGPWFIDDENALDQRSCRQLTSFVTEFEVQGLELDAALIVWGTDFALLDGEWSNAKATRSRNPVRDAWQLRANAYRVLLTRGRDAHVVFVPPLDELHETWNFLCRAGFRPLKENTQ